MQTLKTMFSNSNDRMPSTKTIVSAVASAAATAMLFRSFAHEYLPHELRGFIYSKISTVIKYFSSELIFVVEEYDNLNLNHLYKAVEFYLDSIISPNSSKIKLSMPNKGNKVMLSIEKNEEIIDTFNGATLKWKFVKEKGPTKFIPTEDPYNPTAIHENRFFELTFHKKHKDMVLDSYMKHVVEKSKEMQDKKKTLRLFTLRDDRLGRGDVWQSVILDHPATFDTLALDIEVKRMIMADLERFVKRKEFYRRVGKAWKRGYLLFGPPGTGKSSLIAAIANYLKFDVYDLELTDLRGNPELRRLLISTANRSIIVVEDIDCSIDLRDRHGEVAIAVDPVFNNRHHQKQVTLSGLLNFTDGLWSSCGDERIIIFTTNHKEKLDPALLRPGRMDVLVHMSHCTPSGFKMLAKNYLGITEHVLFAEVEELIVATKVTPAEVGEQLMKSEVPEITLRGLIKFIEHKKKGDTKEEKTKKEASEEVEGLKKVKVSKGESGNGNME